jgi:ankyrin repeat protein
MNRLRIALVAICLTTSSCAFLISDTYKTERYQAIHEATLNGERSKMNEMLDQRPKLIKVADYDDNTLLHLAVLRDHTDEVADLLSRRAKVNATNNVGMTPLHLAAKLNRVEATKLLLKHKPDLSIRDRRDWTSLTWAKKSHHDKVAQLLEEAGAHE